MVEIDNDPIRFHSIPVCFLPRDSLIHPSRGAAAVHLRSISNWLHERCVLSYRARWRSRVQARAAATWHRAPPRLRLIFAARPPVARPLPDRGNYLARRAATALPRAPHGVAAATRFATLRATGVGPPR